MPFLGLMIGPIFAKTGFMAAHVKIPVQPGVLRPGVALVGTVLPTQIGSLRATMVHVAQAIPPSFANQATMDPRVNPRVPLLVPEGVVLVGLVTSSSLLPLTTPTHASTVPSPRPFRRLVLPKWGNAFGIVLVYKTRLLMRVRTLPTSCKSNVMSITPWSPSCHPGASSGVRMYAHVYKNNWEICGRLIATASYRAM